jgi:hypothetical protein
MIINAGTSFAAAGGSANAGSRFMVRCLISDAHPSGEFDIKDMG